MFERMLAGVSTRRYGRTGEPVGEEIDDIARSTSKSAVSRQFVSRTRENRLELMSRPLDDLRLAVLMLDGIDLKGRCCVVALGIDTDGVKCSAPEHRTVLTDRQLAKVTLNVQTDRASEPPRHRHPHLHHRS